ncbi:MAG TPA: CDP-alcohol phosphatidyltransferase family protein [Egibacteraceae bacterium]|nr:CDP-alcohol phosphatidyltransferase family protein [Egibacteraceae bacterium]
MAINAYARSAADAVLRPVVAGLVRVGATADAMTVLGLLTVLIGAGLVAAGQRQAGALVVLAGALLDALDGGVARARGTQRPFGAFLDSVTDRVADVAVFGAVAWLVRDDAVLFTVTLVALGAAQVTSYMRAKAESLGWHATVGVVERAERLGILLLGIFFAPLLVPAVWLLAVGGVVTIAQRFATVARQAREPGPAGGA